MIHPTQKTQPNKGKPTSVRDSNAGHDFHILWATRKVISMLSPNSPLTCIKVEGVSPSDIANLSPDEEHFLAADLTEYYGGEDFATASKIVISQLKYSTRHPDKLWTYGRLCKRRSGNSNDSVIERLSVSYLDLLKAGFTQRDVVLKTKIRLVSNQPLAPKLKRLVDTIHAAFSLQNSHPTDLNELVINLPENPAWIRRDVQKLFSQLTLQEPDFISFLKVLDLTGCGEDTRMGQHLSMMQEIGQSVSTGGRNDTLLQLTDLVRKEALPEKEDSTGLNREDVLAQLGVLNMKELFPEPSHLIFPENLILTEEAKALADVVVIHRRTLAHGIAGVGKSTTIQQLKNYLPPGSQIVLYDCYGAGIYNSINSGRHTLKRALFQISNELSVLTGIPFLVRHHQNEFDMIDAFQDRLNKAAKIVAEAGGLLVLAIDAADNSVAKSEVDGEKKSFVPHFWALTLPDNCRLLMSARTARLNSLGSPEGTIPFELSGFDEKGSAEHFRQSFPLAKPNSLIAFHTRTRHNPRIQRYLLDKAKNIDGKLSSFIYVFRHAHLIPEEIFEDLIQQAVQYQPDKAKTNRLLATLICLQRPIPIEIFAGACAITNAEATDFCQALRPGLIFEDAKINFRDEDFETHLRTRSDTKPIITSTLNHLANHFKGLANSNPYAARVVADHLIEAKQYVELIQLILDEPSLELITDSLLRLQTYHRRLNLAMQSAAILKRDTDGAKLLLMAAEITRTNDAAKSLVLACLPLANHFGDNEDLSEYFDENNEVRRYGRQWLGAMHFQLAAVYARDAVQKSLAEEHLKHGWAWVRKYMNQPKDDRRSHEWEIKDQDIANQTEAVFWLHGVQEAKKSLNRWKPLRARLDSLALMVKNAAIWLSDEEIEHYIREADLPLLGECVVLAALWESKRPIQKERVENLAGHLLTAINEKSISRNPTEKRLVFSDPRLEWALTIAELFTQHKIENATVLKVLDELVSPFPNRMPSEFGDFDEFTYPLRSEVLKAELQKRVLIVDDLIPSKYQKSTESKKGEYVPDAHDSDRRRFREKIGYIFPVFSLRTQSLVDSLDKSVAVETIEKGLDAMVPIKPGNSRYYIDKQRIWLIVAGEVLINIPGQQDLLNKLFGEVQRYTNAYQARNIRLQIAKQAASTIEYRQLALRWLEKIADDAQEDSISIDDRWKVILDCAKASFFYDSGLSRDLYGRAVQAAEQGIGDEVAHRLTIAVHLLKHISKSVSPSEGHRLGAKQAGLVEAYQPFLSGDLAAPFEETIEAVAQLNLTAGLRLSSRWDLLNKCPLGDSAFPLIKGASESNQWSANIGVPLLRLLGDGVNFTSYGLKLLENSIKKDKSIGSNNNNEIFEKLCYWARRDAPVGHRAEAIERIVSWAKENNMAHVPEMKQLEGILSFLSHIRPPLKNSDEKTEYTLKAEREFIEWFERASHGNIQAFRECDDIRLYARLGRRELFECLKELGQQVPFSRRVEFLDLVSKIWLYQDSQSDISVDLFNVFLGDWKNSKPIQDWALNGLPSFYSRNIGRLTNEEDWPSHLEELCSLPLAGESRAALLLPGVADKLEYLSADMLCRNARAIINSLDYTSSQGLIEWLLNRLESQLVNDGKSLPFTKLITNSENTTVDSIECLAEFAWYLFGYPDKRVRWQAVHAIREVLTLRENVSYRKDLLMRLMTLSHTKTSSLAPKGIEFFWMSARVWTMLLVEQLAFELPDEIAMYADSISNHALNSELPHVQICGLARSAILRLQQHHLNILTTEKLQMIEQVNQPITFLLDRSYDVVGDELSLESEDAERFHFDPFDVEDYWFRRLGDVFCQTSGTIATLAEKWICDRWNFAEDDCNKNWDYLNRYEYGLTHFHKSEAIVDSLKTYLTQNALMCVAGELVNKLSVRMEEYYEDSSVSYWDEWIIRMLSNSWKSGWLADLRGEIPLRAECWGKMPEPWEERSTDDYIDALGFGERNRGGSMVIYGSYDFGVEKHYGSVHVKSVLVDSEMAVSLMRALQLSDLYHPIFPTFGFNTDMDDADSLEYLTKDFLLEPTVQELYPLHEGLEQTDISHRKVSGYGILLSDKVVSEFSLTLNPQNTAYRNQSNALVAERESWSDDLRDSRYNQHNPYSSGFRLWMRSSYLQKYMQKQQKDMLIEVILQRNHSESYHEKRYDQGKHILLLLRQDGTFETVDRSCSSWPADHS
ncbi:hypothetical protein [Salmonirosea aquatica]|uniref:ATP-binding protein n=1 Tax=Salmonirosea aquatica TaxID=2654236 RepID=A0A7C9B7F4_9BACT|nr:hypothetical protein [Cytophagaceae bacterium SJW1-29]